MVVRHTAADQQVFAYTRYRWQAILLVFLVSWHDFWAEYSIRPAE